jgi:chromosome partitioning protein
VRSSTPSRPGARGICGRSGGGAERKRGGVCLPFDASPPKRGSSQTDVHHSFGFGSIPAGAGDELHMGAFLSSVHSPRAVDQRVLLPYRVSTFAETQKNRKAHMRIAVTQMKGGAGKTTLALALASALARRSADLTAETQEPHWTLLVDLDDQGTCAHWHDARHEHRRETSPFEVQHHPGGDAVRVLANLSAEHDHVVLDTPGRDDRTMRSAMLAATHVLIPVQVSAIDLHATGHMLRVVADLARTAPRPPRAALVTMREPPRVDDGVLAQLAGYGLPLIRGFRDRPAYRHAYEALQTVHEYRFGRTALPEIERVLSGAEFL